jgi:hypothetical protein
MTDTTQGNCPSLRTGRRIPSSLPGISMLPFPSSFSSQPLYAVCPLLLETCRARLNLILGYSAREVREDRVI